MEAWLAFGFGVLLGTCSTLMGLWIAQILAQSGERMDIAEAEEASRGSVDQAR